MKHRPWQIPGKPTGWSSTLALLVLLGACSANEPPQATLAPATVPVPVATTPIASRVTPQATAQASLPPVAEPSLSPQPTEDPDIGAAAIAGSGRTASQTASQTAGQTSGHFRAESQTKPVQTRANPPATPQRAQTASRPAVRSAPRIVLQMEPPANPVKAVPPVAPPPLEPSVAPTPMVSPAATSTPTLAVAAPKVALATHLKQMGAKMYGTFWCPYCQRQKELLGTEAVAQISYVECDPQGQNAQPNLCVKAGVSSYPTWEIQGQIYPGLRSLEELANLSGYQGPRDFDH
ncbi:hypothetical protein [Leptolyngbya sp. FACHB-261]|uniref:glutaredoxin family protein n=1 Tax=Leptolyngbya sp. FACHB-261 TaxID=2692806 RepID=UPI001682360E|nr:hypothetical protein [Leptolyngbya sp. FACHB-261]MBD2103259.1 hypothetical protein [Leptolyngbya sp. FACHB-261]